MIVRLAPGSLAHEFACHAASCAPPPAGTGGSKSSGKGRTVKAGHGMGTATLQKARYVRSDGTPVSKDYPGARLFVPKSHVVDARNFGPADGKAALKSAHATRTDVVKGRSRKVKYVR